MPDIADVWSPDSKTVKVVNPCPKTRTTEIYERAEVYASYVKDDLEFTIDLQVGASPHRKYFEIPPQGFIECPRDIADDLINKKKHRGLVILDEAKPAESMLRGLREASAFFRQNGSQARIHTQRRRGDSDKDVETFRMEYEDFLLNEAREHFIQEEMERVEQVIRSGPIDKDDGQDQE